MGHPETAPSTNMDTLKAMPGGGEFTDVMDILRDAAAMMKPGQMVFMDNFTLEDAMSVFEIGEPRLDSGFIPEGEVNKPFVPLQSLLPDEICWILDRSFSCEMEWHAGNTLAQTVFTFLYVHHLKDIDPEFLPASSGDYYKDEGTRPQELITVVLRAAVLGLLKCCDLSWRELSKGAVLDGEDWQGDKCEVSILEGFPAKHIETKLEEALNWVYGSHKIPPNWCAAISARLLLRKNILQLMDLDMYKDPFSFLSLISSAREQLQKIRDMPSGTLSPYSPAHLAFDAKISRRLNTFMPIRIHELPPLSKTWSNLEALLDGWFEAHRLSSTTDVLTWNLDGTLQNWLPHIPLKVPYLRSYIQTTFYDGVLVLNRFTPVWLVNRFFTETLGISYDAFATNVKQRWTRSQIPNFAALEVLLPKLLTTHIHCHWYNPPRRRRHLMKSLPHWHALYDQMHSFTFRLSGSSSVCGSPQTPEHREHPTQFPDLISHFVDRSCCAVLCWRMSIIREVLFSGFQLELYSGDEKGFAYWYAVRVIETHLSCMERLLSIHGIEKSVESEMKFYHTILTALQLMSLALFSVCINLMTSSTRQMRSNFHLRYKWAFMPEYVDIPSVVIAPPKFEDYFPDCRAILLDQEFSPSQTVKQASDILQCLLGTNPSSYSAQNRMLFIQNMIDACGRLANLPSSMKEVRNFDVGLLKWDPSIHPWMPIITSEGKEYRFRGNRSKNPLFPTTPSPLT